MVMSNLYNGQSDVQQHERRGDVGWRYAPRRSDSLIRLERERKDAMPRCRKEQKSYPLQIKW